jgi:hypothetical protein
MVQALQWAASSDGLRRQVDTGYVLSGARGAAGINGLHTLAQNQLQWLPSQWLQRLDLDDAFSIVMAVAKRGM